MTMWSIKRRYLTLAIALVSAPGAALAATATGNATVVTIRPMTLVKTDDLDFGSLIASTSAGTVVINPSTDVRTTTGGVSVAGGTPAAARFTGTGVLNLAALIALPTSITLTRSGGTETMTVGSVTTNGGTTRLFTGAAIDVRVGGTLSVAANQVAGNYVGQFNVTVLYL